jgi:hypothetical protein
VTFQWNIPRPPAFELVRPVLSVIAGNLAREMQMQFKTTSSHFIIECSEADLGPLVQQESAVLAEVDAFRSEIAKWAADRTRARTIGAKTRSDELLRWSHEYFGSIKSASDGRQQSETVANHAA